MKNRLKIIATVGVSNLIVGTTIALRDGMRFLTWDSDEWKIPAFFRAWGTELLHCLPWILLVSVAMALVIGILYRQQEE